MDGSHFRLSDVTQPKLNMHKQNNKFPATHFNFVCIFIDASVENSWFRKKYVQFAMKVGILLAF